MSDLDASTNGTTRLRRRSFFENMEPVDPSAASSNGGMDTITLHEGADSSGAAPFSSSNAGDSSSAAALLSSSSSISDSTMDATGVSSSSSNGGSSSSTVWTARALLALLYRQLWFMKSWLIVKWQALGVRARLQRTLRRGGGGAGDKVSTTETLVVKQYAYPTHYIKLACLSLLLLQMLTYKYLQKEPLDLHVEECVFHERMMPTVPARERILAGGGGGGGGGVGGGAGGGIGAMGGGGAPAADSVQTASNLAAMRFLERRFELQLAPALLAQHNSRPRLPWTCISIVPTLPLSGGVPSPTAEKEELSSASQVIVRQAAELAMLLPRSQVVPLESTAKISSRLHLALGSDAAIERRETTGVLATLFPLSSFRENLFPSGFPDLVLVKSEYALKKLVLYRHERQEEFQHRIDKNDNGGQDLPGGKGAQEQDKEEEQRLQYELSKTQFGVFLLKTTVPDIYDRHIRKDWDAFLHVVVLSEQDKNEQLTKEILALWLHHPEWPMLHVRFQQSLTLCGSFIRLMSTMRQVTGDDAEIVDHDERHGDQQLPPNIDITCDAAANSREAIVKLKNEIGIHLFPVPPEVEVYEELALESASAGAIVVTYNTPIMHEWITDACGLRVGSYENAAATMPNDPKLGGLLLELLEVRVTSGDIERAVEGLLRLDRVHRVAAGRAARIKYLEIRTHFLSAIAALDTAICDFDSDETLEQQHEIGQRSRKKVDIDTLRVFLY